MKTFNGIITVGKTSTISLIYTDNTSTAYWYVIDAEVIHGCAARIQHRTTPMASSTLVGTVLYSFREDRPLS